MLHDRDDKYEGSDEPEYHFSEEEGGDFVDSEIPKEATPQATTEPRAETKRAPSKRMMVSLVVFLALVYVVYKMVAPTSQVPSTEISAASPVVAEAPTKQAPKTPAVTKSPIANNATPALIVSQPAVIPVESAPPTMAAAPSSMSSAAPLPQSLPAVVQQTQQNMPMANSQSQPTMAAPVAVAPAPTVVNPPVPTTVMAMPSAAPTMQAANTPMTQQPVTQQPPMSQPMGMQPPTGQQPPSMPSMAPAQAGATVAQQPLMQQPTEPMAPSAAPPTMMTVQSPTNTMAQAQTMAGSNDPKLLALQAESSKLMTQLQTDYVQKINDFSTQNKALQDQVQTLNSRMATMETQMNQLVQALTHQAQPGVTPGNEPPPVEPVTIEQKISYNVQAIIPGRAWLRSDNGETLTVAEGDVVKHLGRVTKIDPYDGIVEINTGTKTVSLSYGTGA